MRPLRAAACSPRRPHWQSTRARARLWGSTTTGSATSLRALGTLWMFGTTRRASPLKRLHGALILSRLCASIQYVSTLVGACCWWHPQHAVAQAEPDLLITTGSDRGIVLFDLRMSTPVRKLIMQTKTNAVAWNPIEAFNFTAASEDCNLCSFDMRQLKRATCVHQDFVSSVMDVDYSPTGREFVAGSYDRTLRIFGHMAGHSREVYHTSRMQRVFAVRFSGDGTYVFSGSDDMNLRVWKVRVKARVCAQSPSSSSSVCTSPRT